MRSRTALAPTFAFAPDFCASCVALSNSFTPFRRDIDEIPIASKAVRLRALDRMARASEEGKDFGRAAELLEQAAKEVGGVYVCRGGPRSIQGQQRSPRSRSTPALTTSPSPLRLYAGLLQPHVLPVVPHHTHEWFARSVVGPRFHFLDL
jgi:hypothetical protein